MNIKIWHWNSCKSKESTRSRKICCLTDTFRSPSSFRWTLPMNWTNWVCRFFSICFLEPFYEELNIFQLDEKTNFEFANICERTEGTMLWTRNDVNPLLSPWTLPFRRCSSAPTRSIRQWSSTGIWTANPMCWLGDYEFGLYFEIFFWIYIYICILSVSKRLKSFETRSNLEKKSVRRI
jgi:hypothetical protein